MSRIPTANGQEIRPPNLGIVELVTGERYGGEVVFNAAAPGLVLVEVITRGSESLRYVLHSIPMGQVKAVHKVTCEEMLATCLKENVP